MMKKLILVIGAVCILIGVHAQSPDLFSYQAVVRDNLGKVISSKAVSLKFSILKTTATGTAQYVETHKPTTDANGLISIEIGAGVVSSGTFASIDWATDKFFLKVELDPAGGSSYSNMGTTQLISVPYAKHATTAQNALNDFDKDSTNELQALSKSGDTIFLSNGGFVQVPKNWDNDSTNELQQLSISNDTIYLSNGGFAVIPDSSLLGVPKGGSGVGAGGKADLKDFDNNFAAVKKLGSGFEIKGIQSDANKNVYVLGTFSQSMILGSSTISVSNGTGLGTILIKLDSNLNVVWEKHSTSGNSGASPSGFIADASGNTYFVVSVNRNTGNLIWDGTSHTITHNQSQGRLFKLNASGVVQWSIPYDINNGTYHFYLAVNSASELYLTGRLWGQTFNFGATSTTFSGRYQQNYGLYKILANGATIQLIDSASEFAANNILVDSQGDILVALSYNLNSRSSNQLRLASQNISLSRNGVLLKYSSSGSLLRTNNVIDLKNAISENPHNFLVEHQGKYYSVAPTSGTWVGTDYYQMGNTFVAELDTGLNLVKNHQLITPASSLPLGIVSGVNAIRIGLKVYGSYAVNDIKYTTLSGNGVQAAAEITYNNNLSISNHMAMQSFNQVDGFHIANAGNTTFLGGVIFGNFYNKGTKFTPGVYLFKE